MNDNEMRLGVMICLARFRDEGCWAEGEGAVEETAALAFALARDEGCTWFTASDDVRFRIGCGVLLIHYKDDGAVRERIEFTLRSLRSLSAVMSRVPVDLDALAAEGVEPLPLMSLVSVCREGGRVVGAKYFDKAAEGAADHRS